MNVLVACECSDTITDAFKKRGHSAKSCDLKPSEHNRVDHLQCDMRTLDYSGIDLLIAHPDCTYLAVSGARWWKGREKEQLEAIEFVKWIARLPVLRIAIENPVGILSTVWRKPDHASRKHSILKSPHHQQDSK